MVGKCQGHDAGVKIHPTFKSRGILCYVAFLCGIHQGYHILSQLVMCRIAMITPLVSSGVILIGCLGSSSPCHFYSLGQDSPRLVSRCEVISGDDSWKWSTLGWVIYIVCHVYHAQRWGLDVLGLGLESDSSPDLAGLGLAMSFTCWTRTRTRTRDMRTRTTTRTRTLSGLDRTRHYCTDKNRFQADLTTIASRSYSR